MRQGLLFFILLPFYCFSQSDTSSFSTKDIPANNQLRYDGLYATKPYNEKEVDSLIGLLRFYKDGSVIHWTMRPINKNWTPDSLVTFNKEHIQNEDPIYRPIGKYKVSGSKVSFIIKTKMTKKIKYHA